MVSEKIYLVRGARVQQDKSRDHKWVQLLQIITDCNIFGQIILDRFCKLQRGHIIESMPLIFSSS
jgi:hypothetical protein